MRTISVLILLLLAFAVNCKGPDKKEPVPADPIHNPEPGPQPDPEPPSPDPGPSPSPDPVPDPEPDPTPEPDPVPEPIPIPDPEPEPQKTFKVNVTYFGSSATATRKAKYEKAICVLKKVVATDEFKNRILNYDSTYTVNMFYDTNNSNAQIYQHILNGNEKLQPEIDNELDVEVEFYYAATSTIGYTYTNVKRIWVNTKYFDTYALPSVAANLMHEWLHKLGYKHAVSYSKSRDHSVPYAIGYMVRTIGKQFESGCK